MKAVVLLDRPPDRLALSHINEHLDVLDRLRDTIDELAEQLQFEREANQTLRARSPIPGLSDLFGWAVMFAFGFLTAYKALKP